MHRHSSKASRLFLVLVGLYSLDSYFLHPLSLSLIPSFIPFAFFLLSSFPNEQFEQIPVHSK